ncbi:MAG: response regulator [Syntrophales bacterium]|jgi:two-component system response regulator BaeR|nr:response regulator [Syntrophales bacterium]MCK9392377.1 response regulator [Syntrophales bacterium]
MAGHILIVEDEQKIAALLQAYLEKAGYSASVLNRGDQVLAWIKQSPPDLMLLDIMLPGMDGIDVCREARKFSMVPIIMITAKVEEVDRLIGLEIGADDYICKPFSPREVVARVKAVLRRRRPEPADRKLTAGPLVLDESTYQVEVMGNELDLTPSEFRLLQVFMSQPGRVFSRDELLVRAQGYDCEGYDRTIDSHIKNLRKKIALHLPDREVINTVYGVGYKLSYL